MLFFAQCVALGFIVRLPPLTALSEEAGEIPKIVEGAGTPLDMSEMPFAVSFGLRGSEHVLIDPSAEEEQALTSSLTVFFAALCASALYHTYSLSLQLSEGGLLSKRAACRAGEAQYVVLWSLFSKAFLLSAGFGFFRVYGL